ncbi:MAG: hypothetical protein QXP53_00485 [Candidatus Pacearchaeota archaeon]
MVSYEVELAKYFLITGKKKKFREPIQQKVILASEEPKIPAPSSVSKKEYTLPPTPAFINLKQAPIAPATIKTTTFDLARLNTFVVDPSVTLIQCDGSGIPLKINKNNEMIQTDVSLNENEINDIIHKFSLRAQVPISEPVFQAKTNGLKIMAIISKHVGSRFIISRVA